MPATGWLSRAARSFRLTARCSMRRRSSTNRRSPAIRCRSSTDRGRPAQRHGQRWRAAPAARRHDRRRQHLCRHRPAGRGRAAAKGAVRPAGQPLVAGLPGAHPRHGRAGLAGLVRSGPGAGRAGRAGRAGAASEAADVVLLIDRLDLLALAIRITRRARRIALESVAAGIALSALGMVAAAAGFLPPLAGALVQEVIDVAVILNALRALGDGAVRARPCLRPRFRPCSPSMAASSPHWTACGIWRTGWERPATRPTCGGARGTGPGAAGYSGARGRGRSRPAPDDRGYGRR